MNSVSFHSKNEKQIFVSEIYCDNKQFMMPVGYLGANGGATALMFPDTFPEKITIKYQVTDNNREEEFELDLSKQKAFFEQHKNKELTLYVIYTDENTFISKVYLESENENSILNGYHCCPNVFGKICCNENVFNKIQRFLTCIDFRIHLSSSPIISKGQLDVHRSNRIFPSHGVPPSSAFSHLREAL